MHIRPMQLSDLPTVATIPSKAFRNDEFFRYICPHLDDYPDDFCAFLRLHRKRILQVGAVAYVAETDETDYEGIREVVGIATWRRVGTSEIARVWKDPNSELVKSLERWLQYFGEVYFSVFVGDGSADNKRVSEAGVSSYEGCAWRSVKGFMRDSCAGLTARRQSNGLGGQGESKGGRGEM
ncbi:hypothetical protein FGG08_002514 [Glutinoglossum americanum]|uniref:Acyl-CoA N-acyltransferase n=1 Tax=Glutinoglossum americanum TaxID=1670608 RepID=A0A9P8L4G1_9PEZI|nr:hypothetical protein FGG08_002514 [Glutinoglossum americanum]